MALKAINAQANGCRYGGKSHHAKWKNNSLG